MATRNDLNRSYRNMTQATEATTAAVNRVDESVKANTRATQLGNVIAGIAAIRAEVNARKTHAKIDAVGGKIDEMNSAVTSKLDQLDGGIQTLTGEVRQTNDNLETIKKINFAQWRDTGGQIYWRQFRPQGVKTLEAYDRLTGQWRKLVAQRMSEVVDHYGEWKDPEWLDNSILDGQYYPYPAMPMGPREVTPPPENLQKKPRKDLTRIKYAVVAFLILSLSVPIIGIPYWLAGSAYEEHKINEQVEEHKNSENPAMYPVLKYWYRHARCEPDEYTIGEIEHLRDDAPAGSEQQAAWEQASTANTEQLQEACQVRNEIYGEKQATFGTGDAKDRTPAFTLASSIVLIGLFYFWLARKNKKIDQHNEWIDQVHGEHLGERTRAHREWEAQCNAIADQWAEKNNAAGKEMQRRFRHHVGVPITGNQANEYWAAPWTQRDVHYWKTILMTECDSPPDYTELRKPSRIELNPKMPEWYRSRFIHSYNAIVPREL